MPTALYRPSLATRALGPTFWDPVRPADFPRHALRFRHTPAAASVGLDDLDDHTWIAHFGRFVPLPDNHPEPLALRYHGHQFQTYNPELGDGRGFLYAQVREAGSGRLLDLGTKGSGRTPYSRGGDGRLTLKGAVREILAAELLEARDVPTCRILSVIETGEDLWRNDEPSPTRSAVLVRLSHSHVRFGTFQRLAFVDDRAGIDRLVAYCLEHLLPEAAEGTGPAPERLLRSVVARTATLGAAWTVAGFVHGVLNTDNCVVTGESFDYGPWRFLPHYDPQFVAAYFDGGGLYAFGRQPEALVWNLARLADTLRLVEPSLPAEALLGEFGPLYLRAVHTRLRQRLGLARATDAADAVLAEAFEALVVREPVPLDEVFDDWWGGEAARKRALDGPRAALYATPAGRRWQQALAAFAPIAAAAVDHPDRPEVVHLRIDRVEALWEAIARRDDWAPLHAAVDAIRAVGSWRRSPVS